MTQSTTSGHPSPTSAQKSPLASASTIASRVGSVTLTTDHPCPSASHFACQQIFFKVWQLAKVQSETVPWPTESIHRQSQANYNILNSSPHFTISLIAFKGLCKVNSNQLVYGGLDPSDALIAGHGNILRGSTRWATHPISLKRRQILITFLSYKHIHSF